MFSRILWFWALFGVLSSFAHSEDDIEEDLEEDLEEDSLGAFHNDFFGGEVQNLISQASPYDLTSSSTGKRGDQKQDSRPLIGLSRQSHKNQKTDKGGYGLRAASEYQPHERDHGRSRSKNHDYGEDTYRNNHERGFKRTPNSDKHEHDRYSQNHDRENRYNRKYYDNAEPKDKYHGGKTRYHDRNYDKKYRRGHGEPENYDNQHNKNVYVDHNENIGHRREDSVRYDQPYDEGEQEHGNYHDRKGNYGDQLDDGNNEVYEKNYHADEDNYQGGYSHSKDGKYRNHPTDKNRNIDKDREKYRNIHDNQYRDSYDDNYRRENQNNYNRNNGRGHNGEPSVKKHQEGRHDKEKYPNDYYYTDEKPNGSYNNDNVGQSNRQVYSDDYPRQPNLKKSYECCRCNPDGQGSVWAPSVLFYEDSKDSVSN